MPSTIDKGPGVTPGARTMDRSPGTCGAAQVAIGRIRMAVPRANFSNRTLFVLAAALAIGAAGIGMQGSSGSAQAQDLDTSASAAAQSGRADCPSNDIADFFQAFAESPELQRDYTASTIETAFVDWSAQPEPVESAEPMERDKLHFPLLPDRASRQQQGLRYREAAGDENHVTVVLEVPDTDTQLRYTFRRDACWTLIKIVDPAFGRAFPGEAPPVETTRPPRRHVADPQVMKTGLVIRQPAGAVIANEESPSIDARRRLGPSIQSVEGGTMP